jgi:hypothetical protein
VGNIGGICRVAITKYEFFNPNRTILTVGVESSYKNSFIRIHNFIAYHENPEFLFDMGDMSEMENDYL